MLNFKVIFAQIRRLAVLHITSICLITFFAISRQVLILKMLQQQDQTAKVIGQLGQQELYSQQISKDVMALQVMHNPAAQRPYRTELAQILPNWEKIQSSLLPLSEAQPLPGKMNGQAAQLFKEAQPEYQGLTAIAQAIVANTHMANQGKFVSTLLTHDHNYLANVSQVLVLYYIASSIHTAMLHNAEIVCFVFTLVILLLEVLVVFRPVMMRMLQLLRTVAQNAETLRTTEEQIQTVLTHAPIVMFTLNQQGEYTFFQGKCVAHLSFNANALLGQSVFEVMQPYPVFCQRIRQALHGQEFRIVEQFDSLIFEINLTPIYDQTGAQTGIIGVATDITDRVQAEQALHHQLLHDPLTNLPNRNLLLDRLDQMLQDVTWKEEHLALLLLDLDHFKDINDTFGHQYGDQLLQQVAIRLGMVLDERSTVARLGGDEFAIILPGVDQEHLDSSVRSIRHALEAHFEIADHLLQVKPSIGVVFAPLHGSDGLTLLRRADVAMYRAKQQHKEYEIYNLSSEQEGICRLALLGAMREAIVKQQMHLNYQPKIDTQSGQMIGVEALLRWQHPVYGFVSPDKFIPLAEQAGMIGQLTHWVLETALMQSARWSQMGYCFSMAVNLSMLDLQDVQLPERIRELLARYQVPAEMLHLELTESALMTDPQQALHILHELSALGVHIAVDDFGTGYSSLSYLKKLPVNELKIDRSFVMQMATVKEDAMIVQSTIALAHNLGLRVVAEGVEDLATSQLLGRLKCDTMQGYYFARPLSAASLEQWLSDMGQHYAA